MKLMKSGNLEVWNMKIKTWCDGIYLIIVWLIISALLLLDLSALIEYKELINSFWLFSIFSFMFPIDKSFIISKLVNKIYK